MAYAVIHHFPGGTKEQYEATLAVVHPSDGSLPAGQLSHVAGPAHDCCTIFATHDSKESWEQFRDSTLVPHMQDGIDGGFAGPPQESGFEIDTQA